MFSKDIFINLDIRAQKMHAEHQRLWRSSSLMLWASFFLSTFLILILGYFLWRPQFQLILVGAVIFGILDVLVRIWSSYFSLHRYGASKVRSFLKRMILAQWLRMGLFFVLVFLVGFFLGSASLWAGILSVVLMHVLHLNALWIFQRLDKKREPYSSLN